MTIEVGSQYELRQPGLVAAGASIRLSSEILLSGQFDYVRFSELRAFVRPGAVQEGGAYKAEDAIEPRVGAELSKHFGGFSLQLRGGLHSQDPGALVYTGSDVVERAVFPGASRRLLKSAGATLVTSNGFPRPG